MMSEAGERQVERGQKDGGAVMKQIFSTAIMVGRTTALTLGVAVMLALMLGIGTTAVAATNLSADRLDGKDANDFQQANATASGDLSGSYPSNSPRVRWAPTKSPTGRSASKS